MLHKFQKSHITFSMVTGYLKFRLTETYTQTMYMMTNISETPVSVAMCSAWTDISSWELGLWEVHFWMSLHEPKHSHKWHKLAISDNILAMLTFYASKHTSVVIIFYIAVHKIAVYNHNNQKSTISQSENACTRAQQTDNLKNIMPPASSTGRVDYRDNNIKFNYA